MPFYHALGAPETGVRHVLCRHEQGAGHAAQGYARASGRIGVCVATSGPGATNLVTPIADAWMDGTPLLAITGQVASHLLGTDAFQEIDIIGITLPIVKHSRLVCSADDIEEAVAEAIRIATEGRPGPVLLDITKDAQQGRALPTPSRRVTHMAAAEQVRAPLPLARQLDAALALLVEARRPLILAGHGVIQSGAADQLRMLAERMDLPVATTLLGLGAIPQGHRLSIGLAGMHGSVAVNRALQACDVLFSVGARFDDRVTGPAARFAPRATVVHLDIEPSQLSKTIPAAVELIGDARAVLEVMMRQAPIRQGADWLREIEETAARRGRQSDDGLGGCGTLPPRDVYRALERAWRGNGPVLVVSDVGQHQMWAAQWLSWDAPGAHVTSGGAGTMGFAVPAALGAAIARPEATVWAIVGDGGFQMTNQELATVVQEGVRNLRIAVINNGYLGMVRQWQQLFHDRRYSGTPLSGPDFPALARSYGLQAVAVEHTDDLAAVLDRVSRAPDAVLIDFRVEREANVFPMVPPGAAIDAMIATATEAVQ